MMLSVPFENTSTESVLWNRTAPQPRRGQRSKELSRTSVAVTASTTRICSCCTPFLLLNTPIVASPGRDGGLARPAVLLMQCERFRQLLRVVIHNLLRRHLEGFIDADHLSRRFLILGIFLDLALKV